MHFSSRFLRAIKYLMTIQTGFGKKSIDMTTEGESVAAIFLPLFGLFAGLFASMAVLAMQAAGSSLASIVAGLVVLVCLGGYRQLCSVARLLPDENRASGAAVVSTLVLIIEMFLLVDLSTNRGNAILLQAIIYMPAAGATAMLSAASVLDGNDPQSIPIPGVQVWHMLLSCVLVFALMLPQFGMKSLAFVLVSILSGSVTAQVTKKLGKKKEAAYTAAIISEILFLFTMLLLTKPRVIILLTDGQSPG